jgi:hypothetical protein
MIIPCFNIVTMIERPTIAGCGQTLRNIAMAGLFDDAPKLIPALLETPSVAAATRAQHVWNTCDRVDAPNGIAAELLNLLESIAAATVGDGCQPAQAQYNNNIEGGWC